MTAAVGVKGQRDEPKASPSWLPLWARRSSLATADSVPSDNAAIPGTSTPDATLQQPQDVAGMTLKGVGIHASRVQSPEAIRAAADASAQAAMVAAEAAEAAPKRRPLFSFRRRRAAFAALYDTGEPLTHAALAASAADGGLALPPHQPQLSHHIPGDWPGYQQVQESADFTALPRSGVGGVIGGRAVDVMATTSNFELPSETRRHAAMGSAGSGPGGRPVSRRRGVRSASLADYGGGGGDVGMSSSRAPAAARGQGAAGGDSQLHAMMSTAEPATLDAAVGSAVLRTAARNGAYSSREQPTR
jgi:hypothetical protein